MYKSYQLSEAQVKAVEEATRGQSKSKIWHEQRAGRVTASTLKAALATSVANPSPSLTLARVGGGLQYLVGLCVSVTTKLLFKLNYLKI